jgi:hypothetical protein
VIKRQNLQKNKNHRNLLRNLIPLNTMSTTTDQWENVEVLEKLDKQMDVLYSLKFSSNMYPDQVMGMALNEVLPRNWETYEGFSNYINKLVYSKKDDRMPFTQKVKDKFTGKWNFWIVKSFVNVNDKFYVHNGVQYPKKAVLMSKQFNDYLRDFCKLMLNDNVQALTFTGSFTGRQNLDMTKVNKNDLVLLDTVDPNDLVMVNFKRKVVETLVGTNENVVKRTLDEKVSLLTEMGVSGVA